MILPTVKIKLIVKKYFEYTFEIIAAVLREFMPGLSGGYIFNSD